ncbi:MAG: DUF3306 domain-containing protein [Stellaceae bacterium]
MSGDESFFPRWSRRKRSAGVTARQSAKPENAADSAASKTSTTARPAEETQSLFDPGSLPTICSIGSGSDVRPFLAAGVPADLTRAALRRAWSADPAIRDFIGLSENSWDFNVLGGVPGFGSLTAEETRRLVAQVMENSARPAVERLSDDKAPPPDAPGRQATDSMPHQMKITRDTDADHRNPATHPQASNIAMQHEKGARKLRSPSLRPRHGGALPR